MKKINLKIKYSAPAKTILSGEHSVCYDKNSLVFSINLRTYTTLTERDD